MVGVVVVLWWVVSRVASGCVGTRHVRGTVHDVDKRLLFRVKYTAIVVVRVALLVVDLLVVALLVVALLVVALLVVALLVVALLVVFLLVVASLLVVF